MSSKRHLHTVNTREETSSTVTTSRVDKDPVPQKMHAMRELQKLNLVHEIVENELYDAAIQKEKIEQQLLSRYRIAQKKIDILNDRSQNIRNELSDLEHQKQIEVETLTHLKKTIEDSVSTFEKDKAFQIEELSRLKALTFSEQESVNKLTKQKEDLQQLIFTLKQEDSLAKTSHDELICELKDLESNRTQIKSEIDKINTEHLHIKNAMLVSQNEKNIIENEIAEKSRQRDELLSEIRVLKSQSEEIRQSYKNWNKQQMEIEAHQAHIATFRMNPTSNSVNNPNAIIIQKKIQNMLSQEISLNEAVETGLRRKEILRDQLDCMNERKRHMERQIHCLNSEIQIRSKWFSEESQKFRQELDHLQMSIHRHKNEFETLQSQTSQQLTILKEDLRNTENSIASQSVKLYLIQESHRKNTQENHDLKRNLAKNKLSCTILLRKKKSLNDLIESEQKKLHELSTEQKILTIRARKERKEIMDANNRLHEKISDLNDIIDQKKEDLLEKEHSIAEYTGLLLKKKEEHTQLQALNDELQDSLLSEKIKQSELKEQTSIMRNELVEVENRFNSLQEFIVIQNTEIKENCNRIEELNKKINEEKDRLGDLHNQQHQLINHQRMQEKLLENMENEIDHANRVIKKKQEEIGLLEIQENEVLFPLMNKKEQLQRFTKFQEHQIEKLHENIASLEAKHHSILDLESQMTQIAEKAILHKNALLDEIHELEIKKNLLKQIVINMESGQQDQAA